jgi:hypothetical protein
MIDWFALLTPLLALTIILLFSFIGCLITDPVEFKPCGIFILRLPSEGIEGATAVLEWEKEGTERTVSQRFPPGEMPEPENGQIRIRLSETLTEGTWLVSCRFTPSEGEEEQVATCPGLSVSEGECIEVVFHVTDDLELEINSCLNGG